MLQPMDEFAKPAPGVYVLAAHPDWRESRVNRLLLEAAGKLPWVRVRDLYGSYADYDIDVAAEQEAAAAAQLLVLLHPIQWYSMPALMKLWLDEVLRYGWAYGRGGTALQGKDIWLVATTGGPEASYHPQGYNRYFFDAFLPPLLLHGAHRASPEDLQAHFEVFRSRLASYPDWPELEELGACPIIDVPTTDRPLPSEAAG